MIKVNEETKKSQKNHFGYCKKKPDQTVRRGKVLLHLIIALG